MIHIKFSPSLDSSVSHLKRDENNELKDKLKMTVLKNTAQKNRDPGGGPGLSAMLCIDYPFPETT